MIDNLIEAIDSYVKAKERYGEACKTCEYDRDYFLSRQIKDVETAKRNIEIQFQNAVHVSIQRILSNSDEDTNPGF